MRLFNIKTKRPPSNTELLVYYNEGGDPYWDLLHYFRKGEKVQDILRNTDPDLSFEERLYNALFSGYKIIEDAGFYTLQEDEEGNIRWEKSSCPVTHWTVLEPPVDSHNAFVAMSWEERTGILNTLENLTKFIEARTEYDEYDEEVISAHALKAWIRGMVDSLNRGRDERVEKCNDG